MRLHGTFATLLLMVPVLSIPALAIFGIPQFAPVVASPLEEDEDLPDRERRVGQSARSSDDFFDDSENGSSSESESFEINDEPPRGRFGDSVAIPRRRQNVRPGSSQRWHSENELEDPRSSSQFDSTPNSKRPNQKSGFDEFDSRFESQPPASSDRFQVASNPSTNRPREQKNDPPPDVRPEARPAVNGQSLTWQDALRQLNDMQIRNFRLQPGLGGNQFVFICSFTPPDSPNVSYRFEAEDVDPLKAVQKVLDQLSEWQQRR